MGQARDNGRTPGAAQRVCACGTRLSASNTGTRCAVCERKFAEGVTEPPVMPRDFWYTERFREAFESQKMGKVLHAFRTDERHKETYGPGGIRQTLLASWLGITQVQVSRLEQGKSLTDSHDKMIQWAQILSIPGELLWFDLPGQNRQKLPPRKPVRPAKKHGERTGLKLARKAAGLTQEQLAERLPVDRKSIGRWESGERTPTPYMWPKLAKLLGVSSERLTELLAQENEPDNSQTEHGKNEPEAIAQTGAEPMESGDSIQVVANFSPAAVDVFAKVNLAAEPGEFLSRISVETPVPGRIEWSDVEHIRSTTRAVATAENVFGGGLSCEAAMGQLRWAGKLLDARADNDVRHAMFEAVGNLSSVVAYSAFDVSAYDAADRCFHFALWCSDQGGSWALRANTLAEMSRKAAYLGDLDDALSMIEFAQVRSDRLTSRARAMLCTLRARLLALTSRNSEARSDIARADAYFHEGDGEQNPPWLTYYDFAEHQGSIGKALIPIAQAEQDVDIAAPRLRDAIELHRENYPRSRAFSRTRLATLAMDIGDPHEAVALGRQLLDEVAPLRSDRINNELRGLARVSDRYSRIGDVKDLRHDILSLTPSKD